MATVSRLRTVALTTHTVDVVARLARRGDDHVTLLREVDRVMRAAVGYDFSAWATIDPGTCLVTGCLPVGDDPFEASGHLYRTFEIEYLGTEPLTLSTVGSGTPFAGSLHTLADEVTANRRYREILAPAGLDDELFAVFSADGQCWGAVRAYRQSGAEPFTRADLDRFTAIAQPLAEGLRLAFLRAATGNPDGLHEPPGVVMITDDGRIRSATGAAESLLRGLDGVGDGGDGKGAGDDPTVLRSLAARLSHGDVAAATLTGRGGPVTLHASRLADDQLVVIVERPRPPELTPRIMDAYDLTPRESEVTLLVLRGSTTAQIARHLDMSAYTVQDHLKSVFAKVDVQTRGELAHALHTRFYLPPRRQGAVPSPYGYFLGA
jgi:DNA-binding CsgD family transcriptional regulator